jgi:ABC-type uncharacterized transport system fused permease/ATPase subunit
VLDDAISALDESHRSLVLSLKDRELVGATLIRLGRDSVLDGFWDQTLHIIDRPGGPHLRTNQPPQAGAVDALPTSSSPELADSRVEDRVAKDGHSAT